MVNLLVIIIAALGFFTVVGVGFMLSGNNAGQAKTLKRAHAIAGGPSRADLRRTRTAANAPEARRKQIIASLKEQDRVQRKARLNLANKLQQAGLAASPTRYWIVCAVLGVVAFLACVFFHLNLLIALGLSLGAGVGLPMWTLGFLAKRRLKKFTEAFSDAMDIVVRGIKSGLPVHDCLKIIGRECPEPLAGEFRRLVENIGVGMNIDQALDKLYERMPTPEVRFFAIVMNVQSKTGGNLAEALGNLSAVLRSRKLMREKIKALSSEATASAMIIGCMPPGVITMITVTTPSYMSIMWHDPRGQLMLAGGAFWMGLGIFVMRRMINFKF